MSTAVKTRTFHFEVPSTTLIPWRFKFRVTFTQVTPRQVAVTWTEYTTGRGHFAVRDCGITWKSALAAWRECSREAHRYAAGWNKMDDHPRD